MAGQAPATRFAPADPDRLAELSGVDQLAELAAALVRVSLDKELAAAINGG